MDLNRAQDIYAAVKPFYIVSKIFGLAPYPLKGKVKTIRQINGFMFLNLLWTSLWVIFFIFGMIMHVTNLPVFQNEEVSMKRLVTFSVFIFCAYCSNIVSLILEATVCRRYIPKILRKISAVDSILMEQSKEVIVYSKTRFILVTEVLILSVMLAIFSYCYIWVFCDNTISCICAVSQTLSMVSNVLMIFQFINFTMLLKQRYKILNSWITPIYKSNNQRTHDVSNPKPPENKHATKLFLLIQSYRRFKEIIRNHQEGTSDGCDDVIVENKTTKLANILQNSHVFKDGSRVYVLRIIFSELYEIVLLVNKNFGWSLLVGILWMFVSIVCNVYFSVDKINAMSNSKDQISQCKEISLYIVTLCCSLALMAIVTACSHLAFVETRKSEALVHKLLLLPEIGPDLTEELNLFASQASVMKAKFTACGLFVVNLRVLFAIISLTATYMVLMGLID